MAEALKEEADSCMRRSEPKRAAAAYTKAIKAAGEGADSSRLAVLRSNRAAALTKLSKAQLALSDAHEASRLAPSWPKGYYRAALALELEGKHSEALQEVRKAKSAAPSDADILKKEQLLRKAASSESDSQKGTNTYANGSASRNHQRSNVGGLRRGGLATSGSTEPRRSCVGASGAEAFLARAAKTLGRDDENYKRVEGAVSSAEHGKESPRGIAQAIAQSAFNAASSTSGNAWKLASGLQEVFYSAEGSKSEKEDAHEQALKEFEQIREQWELGMQLPLPETSGALVHASRSSNNLVSRKAFEALSNRVLQAARKDGNRMFENASIKAMLNAGLAEAVNKKLEAEESDADWNTPLSHACEAAASALHNMLAQARRICAALAESSDGNSDSNDPYTELCAMLEREGNPLDMDLNVHEWDPQAAHQFFVPFASFFGFEERRAQVLSNLCLIRIRANIVDCVAQSRDDMAKPLCNVLTLVLRVRSRDPPAALKALAERSEVVKFQQEAREQLNAHKRFARRVQKLSFEDGNAQHS